jgi:hypothetical protein
VHASQRLRTTGGYPDMMASMSRKPKLISHRLRVGLLAAIAASFALTGCRTATTAPLDTRLAGQWNLDKAASDDASAKVAAAINNAQQTLRRRNADRYGMGAGNPPAQSGNNGAGATDAPDESFDTPGDRYGNPGMLGPDFRTLRARLQQALLAPASLRLDVQGDLVGITSNQLPPREYHLGERISRFDEYGTSVIDARWSHDTFVLRSSYTSHASRIERYEVNPSTGLLSVTQQINDPTVGRIAVRSIYRRS